MSRADDDLLPGESRVDRLARLRTELANERTLLAWFRTGLALVAGGVTLIRLGGEDDRVFAWSLLAAGSLCLPVAGWRYVAMGKRIRRAAGG